MWLETSNIRTTALIDYPIVLTAFFGTFHMLINRGFSVVVFDYPQTNDVEAAYRQRQACPLSARQMWRNFGLADGRSLTSINHLA